MEIRRSKIMKSGLGLLLAVGFLMLQTTAVTAVPAPEEPAPCCCGDVPGGCGCNAEDACCADAACTTPPSPPGPATCLKPLGLQLEAPAVAGRTGHDEASPLGLDDPPPTPPPRPTIPSR